MASSLESIATALKDGARFRARVIGGMSCIEVRKRNYSDFATCGAHTQDIGAALFCANARLGGGGGCRRECQLDSRGGGSPKALSPADSWLAHEGNSFEVLFSSGTFTVVKYRRGATAEVPSVASDLDTAMHLAFPTTIPV